MKTTTRKAAMLLGALAIIGMGGAVACSPGEKHETPETSVSTPAPSSTDKAVRTNVTRAPMSVAPQHGGNAAVPCGFGPAGGGPCSHN